MMSSIEKKIIVDNIYELLIRLVNDGAETQPESRETASQPVEMLTIRECTEVIQGLSEHTVRQLVAQEKVKSVRTGAGKRGKILVNKADLMAYFRK
ncbi:DNA-binding protein [Ruminococcus albus]|uniref:DNA binding domain-containing protein, excisionase family n=1 Tax=Ruminococcus albus (strain ATCC 27210 / DSM 20455 / JCM 14654 / NCDO 2250 / 7) TaxID=697329 RepID=E6UHJ5_RUMA7|nr:hypothetical protein Rumal_0698 [Ruminococcus albus 7 = DSM 20455]